MKPRVGIGLGFDRARVLLVKRDRVHWAGEALLEPDGPLVDALEAVLRQVPGLKRRRPSVAVAVGPHHSQIKELTGLPAVTDPRLQNAMVRESASTFFLENGVPLVTALGDPSPGGRLWAGAIEQDFIAAAHEACRRRGWSLDAAVPGAVALGFGTGDRRVRWSDGGLEWDLLFGNGTLERVRRTRASSGGRFASTLLPAPELLGLGERAWQFADAYGAAVMPRETPLRIDPRTMLKPTVSARLSGFRAPLVLLLVALVALAATPLRDLIRVHADTRTLDELRSGEAIGIALGGEEKLHLVTGILHRLDSFAVTRPARTAVLAAISTSLPAGTAVQSVTLEGNRGELAVLSPDAGQALLALQSIDAVESAELVGEVSRHRLGAAELDRLTVRLLLAPPAPPPADPVARP